MTSTGICSCNTCISNIHVGQAINNIESEFYLMSSMGVKEIPCEATLRQRMDKYADKFLPIVEKSSIDIVLEHNLQNPDQADIDFLIKWNPRRQDKADWLKQAQQHGAWTYPREGKRVAVFSHQSTRHWQGYDYQVRQIIRLTERTIDKHGQALLIPEIHLEGWWTSLALDEADIIQLYADHGTSEQFHSEFKTDMDIERLPSGKFATNALVLACSVLVYNVLRWIENFIQYPH